MRERKVGGRSIAGHQPASRWSWQPTRYEAEPKVAGVLEIESSPALLIAMLLTRRLDSSIEQLQTVRMSE